MTPTSDKPAPPTPIRWANVYFWQLSGVLVGGLLPLAALAVAFVCLTRGEGGWLFCFAPLPVFAGAVLGFGVGTIIGLADKDPTFGSKHNRPK